MMAEGNSEPAASGTAATMLRRGGRIDYMDNLRALAMVAGVLRHASLAYGDNTREFWLVRDADGSVVMDTLSTFGHVFRMGLFFLIAGFFAKMLVERRGVRGFLRNRMLRIALPFAIFMPLVSLSIAAVIRFMYGHLSEFAPIVQVSIARAAQGEAHPPTTVHLWFLYHLTMFCGLAALVCQCRPRWSTRAVRAFFGSPSHLLYLPLIIVPALLCTGAPTYAPDSFVPELWSFGYHGVYFLLGWHLFAHHEAYMASLIPHTGRLLCGGLLAFAAFMALLPSARPLADVLANRPPPLTLERMALVAFEAYASMYLVFSALCIGKRLLHSPHRLLRYVSGASYWIYIVHLPFVLYMQVILAQTGLHVWLKFAICSLTTLSVCGVTYALFVRHTPLGTLLQGKREPLRLHAFHSTPGEGL